MKGRTDDEDAEAVRAGLVSFLSAVLRDDTSTDAAFAGGVAAICEMAWGCRTDGIGVDELVAAFEGSARSYLGQLAVRDAASRATMQ